MLDTNTPEAQQETDMLRESAVDFVRRSMDTKKLQVRRRTLPGYEAATLGHMAELGWLGILVPEAYGGLGLGFAEIAVVLQELGRGSWPIRCCPPRSQAACCSMERTRR
jgi:alkylation response protein AidB-like acyl-CoA dehydrogenase